MSDGGGSSKAIIKLPISVDDAGSVDALLEKIAKYKEHTAEIPAHWAAHAESVDGAADSIGGAKNAVTAFAKATGDHRLTGQSSFIALFSKESKSVEKRWVSITREIERSSKFMMNLSRGAITLGAAGGVLGALGGLAGGALLSARKITNDLSDDNRKNRELGLSPGEVPAFNADAKPLGLSDADIATTAAAQQDPTKWLPFRAAGISTQEIKTADPADLLLEFNRRASAVWRDAVKNGQPAGAVAHARGFDQILSDSQLRLGASYSDDQHQQMAQQFHSDVPKFALKQADEDAATEQRRQLDIALDAAERQVEAAFMKLTPIIVQATTAFADTVSKFVKSEDFGKDLDDLAAAAVKVEGAFDEIQKAGNWLADKLNALMGGNHAGDLGTITSGNPPPPSLDSFDWRHPFGKVTRDTSATTWPWDTPASTPQQQQQSAFKPVRNRDEYFAALERQQGLTPGMLAAVEKIESNNGQNNVGPMTKYGWRAMGPFQFSPDNIKKYHVDPMDERMESAAASLELKRLLVKYHDERKAIAAYNWGEGNLDTSLNDPKHTGDWTAYTPKETQKYLAAMADDGQHASKQAMADQVAAAQSAAAKAMAAQNRNDSGNTTPQFVFKMPVQNPLPARVDLHVTNPTSANVWASAGSLK